MAKEKRWKFIIQHKKEGIKIANSTKYLSIKNLSFIYPHSAIPIFQDLNLEFEQGWSSIVGANGSGKSTLLKLIAKIIKHQSGSIKGNELSYYCAQSTQEMPQDFEEFMFTYTSKAFKVRDLLGLEDSWLNSWTTLSHGERKRVQLALALFKESDILLIDEPTNHLDYSSKKIVIEALKSFKGIGILVSHDRELLDTLSHCTVILKNQDVITYKTSYSNAINEYYKNIDKNDSDAKTKINLARLTGKDKNDGQLVSKLQSKQKQIQANNIQTEKTYKTGIKLKASSTRNIFPIVFEKNALEIAEDKKLFYPTLSINETQKIGIEGNNGTGKSSFLKHILCISDLEGEYLYIPQEISQEQSKKVFDTINDLPNEIKGEIYTIVQRLSSNPKKLQDSFIPSPGETRKLMIAEGLLQNPSLIILDEPTNHMDLDSIVSLESALAEYNGAMIIISHDKNFLDAIVSDIWSFTKKSNSAYFCTQNISKS